MVVIPGSRLQVAASLIAKRSTGRGMRRDLLAWRDDSYVTVRLDARVRALRVHVGGGEGAVTAAHVHLASGASPRGAWFAIGDFIQPYGEYIATRALPLTNTRF